ncbi:hypothetical protein WK55_22130 [Burkholderia ubonensis]|uniref:hypothetical protein n=1 Tax=Burkholderia ubonensis TaxID=101571 RepID=UPI000752A05E|nr:hypothetical protein [Burkholderia ubonensis]KVT54034.1 hypothetical protein WK55_22130 [Burkholderia ubonensis]
MNVLTLVPILFAPYRYAHPDHRRFDGLDLTQLSESLANQWLIDRWALPADLAFDFEHDPEVATCVQYWIQLPRICYLIGLLRLRREIVEQAWYPCLDALARQFLLIPALVVPAAHAIEPLRESDVFAAGAACCAAVFRRMPVALRARLPLLFPVSLAAGLARQLDNPQSDVAIPPFIFSLAHRYAVDTHSPIS